LDWATLSSQELEIRAEVWQLLFSLLAKCACTTNGRSLMIMTGLGTVLVDLLQLLLHLGEACRQKYSPSQAFAPTAVTHCLQVVLGTMAALMHTTGGGGSTADTALAVPFGPTSCSQATFDCFVWYVFTCGQVQTLCGDIRPMLNEWRIVQSAESGANHSGKGVFPCGTVKLIEKVALYLRSVGLIIG
jgi:hypothetical protein